KLGIAAGTRKYMKNLMDYIENNHDKMIIHSVADKIYRFRFNWDTVVFYLVNEKKIINENDIYATGDTTQDALIVCENQKDFQFHFIDPQTAKYYLQFIKLILHKNFFFDLKNTNIVKISHSNKFNTHTFTFKLNNFQFFALKERFEF